MTTLYIMRHGEAVCNVQNIVGGAEGCQGLTDRGHAQADKLRQRLATGEIAADVLYASTFRRARETAEAAAQGLGLPITWDDDLQEVRPGDADTLTYAEMRQRYPFEHQDRVFEPWAPNAESWAGFVARAGTALSRIVRVNQGKRIAIVAHGGIIESSFYLFMGLPLRSGTVGAGFLPNHTSITEWRQINENGGQRWFLARFNDDNHLSS